MSCGLPNPLILNQFVSNGNTSPNTDLSPFFSPGAHPAYAGSTWQLVETGSAGDNCVSYASGTIDGSGTMVITSPGSGGAGLLGFNNATHVFTSTYLYNGYMELQVGLAPIVCWTLTYSLEDGRMGCKHGPGRPPSVVRVPLTTLFDSCVMVEDGVPYPRESYSVERCDCEDED